MSYFLLICKVCSFSEDILGKNSGFAGLSVKIKQDLDYPNHLSLHFISRSFRLVSS